MINNSSDQTGGCVREPGGGFLWFGTIFLALTSVGAGWLYYQAWQQPEADDEAGKILLFLLIGFAPSVAGFCVYLSKLLDHYGAKISPFQIAWMLMMLGILHKVTNSFLAQVVRLHH